MSDGVHLLIPFAGCNATAGGEARASFKLPQLQALLAVLHPGGSDGGGDGLLSPPHERVLASVRGVQADDGCIPWAALQVQQAGRGGGAAAWAWITPCHWHVAADHIIMGLPQDLRLEAGESEALMAAMQPFFMQDGIALEYHAPSLWLARGEIFRGLATASLDRVAGRDIDPWIPRTDAARTLRRLQQEMQMLLYTHTINDTRIARGLLPVNSFWASGTGALPAASSVVDPPAGFVIDHGLRDAAQRQDWRAWADAWTLMDQGVLMRLRKAQSEGKRVTLTLCGQRNARSWSSGAGVGLVRRIAGLFSSPPVGKTLEAL